MALLYAHAWCLLLLCPDILSGQEPETCSQSDGSCAASPTSSERGANETLGEYLLRKQEALYTKSAHSPSVAMSIKMVNPNNKYYDTYWYNPHRNPSRIYKGSIKPKSVRSTNRWCPCVLCPYALCLCTATPLQ